MSERKVLNKYYPPDFDASKLPRVKRDKNRQFTIRLMAPFNMRCKTCGEYIYRGKKFNARKEDVIGKTYLGIQIYRFYIKCTKCLAEITFLTDPENQDYEMENGAMRNFECIRLAEKQAEIEAKQAKDEEVNNPMKILENRTRDSRREMALLETLEDLRELNAANLTVDPKSLIDAEEEMKRRIEEQERAEDEAEIEKIFGKKSTNAGVFEIVVDDIVDEPESVDREFKSKKTKLENDEVEENSKKIKTETTSTSVLFKKPSPFAKPAQSQPETLQLKKSNVSSFIKKKEPIMKTEPVQEEEKPSKQIVNPLSLLSSYDDEDDDSNNSE